MTDTQVKAKFDQYGRYVLPDPETGEERSWTRATTIANTLADRFGLEQWAKRNVVLGIAAREDLYALAVSCKPEDKDQLNRIAAAAEEAAKAHTGANLGTALHRITERVDRGEDMDIPDQWRPDVDAYCQALVDNHLIVDPDWMERIVVLPEYGIAGTLDRLLYIGKKGGMGIIGDLKTGQDVVRYGMTEIAIQLAIYANATHAWNGVDYEKMPPVYTDRALVIHLPVGQGRCEIHQVDIRAGMQALRAALWVREWRKRRDLSEPYKSPLADISPLGTPTGKEVVAADDADDDW